MTPHTPLLHLADLGREHTEHRADDRFPSASPPRRHPSPTSPTGTHSINSSQPLSNPTPTKHQSDNMAPVAKKAAAPKKASAHPTFLAMVQVSRVSHLITACPRFGPPRGPMARSRVGRSMGLSNAARYSMYPNALSLRGGTAMTADLVSSSLSNPASGAGTASRGAGRKHPVPRYALPRRPQRPLCLPFISNPSHPPTKLLCLVRRGPRRYRKGRLGRRLDDTLSRSAARDSTPISHQITVNLDPLSFDSILSKLRTRVHPPPNHLPACMHASHSST
jgi:hypothetical protein